MRNIADAANRILKASNDELETIARHDPDMIRDVMAASEAGREPVALAALKDMLLLFDERGNFSATRQQMEAAIKKGNIALYTSPPHPANQIREALIKAGDDLYATFTGRGPFTDGQIEALCEYAKASNCYRAALSSARSTAYPQQNLDATAQAKP